MRAAMNTSAASAASHSDAAINNSAPRKPLRKSRIPEFSTVCRASPICLGELTQGHVQLPGIQQDLLFSCDIVIQAIAVGARKHEFLVQAAFAERLGVRGAEFHTLDATLHSITAQRFAGLLI